jgi:hypothetical protein
MPTLLDVQAWAVCASFRVARDVLQDVGVVLDDEVETPILVDASLPPVFAFVVLLGAEGGVAEVLEQEQRLLVKRRLDICKALCCRLA